MVDVAAIAAISTPEPPTRRHLRERTVHGVPLRRGVGRRIPMAAGAALRAVLRTARRPVDQVPVLPVQSAAAERYRGRAVCRHFPAQVTPRGPRTRAQYVDRLLAGCPVTPVIG